MTVWSSTVTGNTAPVGIAGGLFLGSFGALDGSAPPGLGGSGTRGDECIIFYGDPFAMRSLGANVLATPPAAGRQRRAKLTHAPLPGSPAIVAGDAGAAPATEQRGVSRPQTAGPDAGAFEVEVP